MTPSNNLIEALRMYGNKAELEATAGPVMMQAADELERQARRLRQAEASLSVWDDDMDSRYWAEYPDAADRALGQSAKPEELK